MFRKFLLSKLHGITVTEANINYEGSITLPPEVLNLAGFGTGEAVNIWNVTNGNRFETYTLLGEEGSNVCCINGAAARQVTPGDKLIVAQFGWLSDEERIVRTNAGDEPRVLFFSDGNVIKDIRGEKWYNNANL